MNAAGCGDAGGSTCEDGVGIDGDTVNGGCRSCKRYWGAGLLVA